MVTPSAVSISPSDLRRRHVPTDCVMCNTGRGSSRPTVELTRREATVLRISLTIPKLVQDLQLGHQRFQGQSLNEVDCREFLFLALRLMLDARSSYVDRRSWLL